MKNNLLCLLLACIAHQCLAQDSAEKWTPFFVSTTVNSVPVNSINGTDTGYVNSFSIAPSFAIRSRSGWGIMYSPRIVMGSSKPGIYLHEFSGGVSQYDGKQFNYEFKYSHYFLTNTTGVPYTPLNNELYGFFSYRKLWLAPTIATGIGFGKDTTSSNPRSAHDIGISFGISHEFSWDGDLVSYSLIPRVLLNAGTNEYFSLMHFNKYVGHGKNFLNYVNTVPGKSRGTGKGKKSSSNQSSATNTAEKLSLSNVELGIESEIDIQKFAIRPEACLFIPIGAAAGERVSGFWQITFEYKF